MAIRLSSRRSEKATFAEILKLNTMSQVSGPKKSMVCRFKEVENDRLPFTHDFKIHHFFAMTKSETIRTLHLPVTKIGYFDLFLQ